MKVTPQHNARMAKMSFSKVYPLYVNKVEKKGRTKAELDQVLKWLTGFTDSQLQTHIDGDVTFESLFEKASLHPNAHLIKGVVCGYRIEDIDNALTQKVRFMDKLVEELTRGRKMEKILRT